VRWRQDRHTGEFIPVDEAAAKADAKAGIIVRDIEPFVSPVDNTLIRNHRELEEHNRRNNVVSASEFSPEYLSAARKKRADFFAGKRSAKENLARKQELYETIVRAERGLPIRNDHG